MRPTLAWIGADDGAFCRRLSDVSSARGTPFVELSLDAALHGGPVSIGPGAVIYTVNIDQDPLISGALGIGTVPVAAFLREGAEVDRWVGYRPAFVMRRPLQRFFGSSTTAR